MKKVTEILNIKYPIIMGSMSRITTAELVAAVSEAGGLGVLTSVGYDEDGMREEIKKVRELTDKPFAVNFMLQMPNINEMLEVVIDEGVKIVATGAGTPKPFMEKFKENDMIVISVIASVKHAKKMEEIGVDIVVAEGSEAGGHIGQTSTFVLVPQVADAVSIPVIGAGGVYDKRSVDALNLLGASGVQAGTIFLATEEAPIGQNYKQALVDANDTATAVTGYKLGHPVRGLANELTDEYTKLEYSDSTAEELEQMTVGSNPRAIYQDDMVTGSVMAGQVAGRITEIKTVKELIEDLFEE